LLPFCKCCEVAIFDSNEPHETEVDCPFWYLGPKGAASA
jgi:hypothetical protein